MGKTRVQLGAVLIARVPSLPISWLDDACETGGDGLAEALGRLGADADFREALTIASPELLNRVDQERSNGALSRHSLESLYCYAARACGRATPFGLFAGCRNVTVGTRSQLLFIEQRPDIRVNLDAALVADIAATVSARLAMHPDVLVFTNSTLFIADRHACYLQSSRVVDKPTLRRTEAPLSIELDACCRMARHGARRGELADWLVARGYSQEDALLYLRELAEHDVLVDQFRPCAVDPDALSTIQRDLATLDGVGADLREHVSAIAYALQELQLAARITSIDCQRIGALCVSLTGISPPKTPIQVEQVPAEDGLAVSAEILDAAAAAMQCLLGWQVEEPDALRDFKRRFEQRFGDEVVPLLQALDERHGIAFSVTQGSLNLPDGGHLHALPAASTQSWPLGTREERLLGEIDRLRESGERVLDLRVLPPLHREGAPMPRTGMAMFRLALQDPEQPDSGKYLLGLPSCGGQSAATLLGRFASLDNGLEERLSAVIAREDALLPGRCAEVAYMPDNSSGNVVRRKLMRPTQVPVLARSLAPVRDAILLSELCVSIEAGRVRLTRDADGAEIVPRLGCAHNPFSTSLPVYQFLYLLERSVIPPSMAWQWGALSRARWLPRVQYGDTVLAPETWRLTSEEVHVLRQHDAAVHAKRLVLQRGLPRWIVVLEGDRELPVDLGNPLARSAGLRSLARTGGIVSELWPTPRCSALSGLRGRYHAEFVVSFASVDSKEHA